MALGLTMADIKAMPGGTDLEYTDPASGRKQAKLTQTDLDLFNLDLSAIAAQYASDPIRAALEKHQRETLVLARNVMYSASQPYGGANALSDEVCARLLRPVDVAIAADIWDVNLSGQTPPVSYAWITADAMAEEEGNIILGYIDPVPLPGVSAVKLNKGGRDYGSFTLSFTTQTADSVAFVEAMAPITIFPEETYTITTCCVRAVNPDRLQAVGLHICRVSNIRTITS